MAGVFITLPVENAGGGGGGGGDASAANQLTEIALLQSINNNTPKLFTKKVLTETATQDIWDKYIGAVLTETTTITYTDSSKATIADIQTV